MEKENIDWLRVFEQIDIEKDIEVEAHITNTIEEKALYFNLASYNLTLQYLLNFKRETFFFSDKRKVDYIEALNISPPKVVRSESSLFNQTVFDADCNYYNFLNSYKERLKTALNEHVVNARPQEKTGTNNDGLENYRNYFAMLTIFQQACTRTDTVFSEDGTVEENKSFCITEPAVKFLTTGLLRVFEMQSGATNEIEAFLILPNNNVNGLIKKIHLDCDKISKEFDLINGEVRIYFGTKNFDGSNFRNHIKTFSDNEQDFYYGYATLVRRFYDFYNHFVIISGIDLTNMPSKAQTHGANQPEIKSEPLEPLKAKPSQPIPNTEKPELSLPQISLMLYYKGQKVTRKNGNDIAKEYGYNSGEKLFQLFTRFSSRSNRIGIEDTLKKNGNKLKLFESVIQELTLNAKQRAIDEMNILKMTIEKEFHKKQ